MVSNVNHATRRILKTDEPRPPVVIVDDHAFLAQSLARILEDSAIPAVVSSATRPFELIADVESRPNCLVLLDLALSAELGNGRDLIPDLIDAGAAVVILTGSTDPILLAECYEAGARGVIDKALPAERVVELVARALHGEQFDTERRLSLLHDMRIARERRIAQQAPFRSLTKKEQAVLEHLADGLAATEIAEVMFVSISTVRTHIRSILMKLGVHSQLAAVALAYERHWLH